jgi:hypothetical protein
MQFGLHAVRHLGQILQEQRASGGFKEPRARAHALDRAPLFVAVLPALRHDAEQLVLEILRRRIGAVHDDEGRVGPPPESVNRVREHLSAGAALAIQQDRATAGRDARQHFDDLPHRRRAAEHAGGRAGRRFLIVRFVGQADEILCVGDDRAQVPGHDRPGKHVEHTRRETRRVSSPAGSDRRSRRSPPAALGADAARDAERVTGRSRAIQ